MHPVAVRVTPGIDNCLEDQEKETLSNNVEEMVLIKSIQRPQAKKLSRMYFFIHHIYYLGYILSSSSVIW